MALRLNDIEVEFRIEAKKALAQLEAIREDAKRAEKSLSRLTDAAKTVGVGLLAVGASITTAFALAIKGAAAEEESLAQLVGTVNATGASFEQQRPKIEGFLADLTKTTKFTDDELRPALNRAIVATNDVDKGLRAAELGAKIAAAGFGNLEGNAVLVARLFEGQARAIGRLIPEFRDLEERIEAGAIESDIAAEALARLNTIAENAPSPQPITQLTKAFGELGDAVGKTALESITPFVTGLTSAVTAVESFAKSAAGKVVTNVVLLTGIAATLLGGLLLLTAQLITSSAVVRTWAIEVGLGAKAAQLFGVALRFMTGPIGLIITLGTAIAGLSFHFDKLSKAAEEARDKLFTSERVVQFKDEIGRLSAAIAGLEAGTLSAGKAQQAFNAAGVADLEQAKQRKVVLEQIVARLEAEKKALQDVAAARATAAATKEQITSAQGVDEARLQSASDRVKNAAALGQIDAAAAAEQEAVIERTRIALRVQTLQKLLDLEEAAGAREVAAQAKTAAANEAALAPLRADLRAEQIKASTAGLASEAAALNARLDTQKAANDEFIGLIVARQQADEAAAQDRVSLGTQTEEQLTQLLVRQLDERTNFQRADIQQRLEALKVAGLQETKLAEDLTAELIKIDLAAETQRTVLLTAARQQRIAKERQDETTSRELRRLVLVTAESDLQKARLTEIQISFEEELAAWQTKLDDQLITQAQFNEASIALEKSRSRAVEEVVSESIALQQSLEQAGLQAVGGLFTLAANGLVDFASGVKNAGAAATAFFKQLLSDFSRAIARALILNALIAAFGGGGTKIGGFLKKLFADPGADQMARFEGQRFADLFFQGLTREMGNARDRIDASLTDNRNLVENRSGGQTVIVNEASPETTVEWTDRRIEPRVRARKGQRTGQRLDVVGNPI